MCVIYVWVWEKNKRQKRGSAYQWESSPTGKMKKNYMNEFASAQPLLPIQWTKQVVRDKA